MPNDLYSRELKSATLVVKNVQRLVSIMLQNGNFKATYIETRLLADGTELTATKFSVDRSLDDVDLTDWIAQGAAFAEQWRQQDEDKRAADQLAIATEALRWAALTPEEQKAESDAAIAKRPVFDPTPRGP